MGPAILVTLGVLFLLDNVSNVDFGKTWPAILLVIGVVKLMQSNASSAGHFGPLPPGTYPTSTYPNVPPGPPPGPPSGDPPTAPQPPVVSQTPQPPSSGEVNNA